MAKLSIDLSGMSGLAPRFYGDKPYAAANPQLRHFGKQHQMADGIYNPVSLLGCISPANNTTKAVTGTTPFLLTSAIAVPQRLVAATTDAIFFADEATTGTTGKIMNLDTAVDTSLDQAYEIPVFGGPDQYSKSEDFALYQVNGIRKIFFTRTNTTTVGFVDAIGIASYAFASVDEDWSATLPVGASTSLLKGEARLVLVLADNGLLYVLNANTVHSIDGSVTGGTNGTINPDVLVFLGDGTTGGSGTVTNIVDGIDLRGKMFIGIHVNGSVDPRVSSFANYNFNQYVGVYIWDRRTTVAAMQDFVPIPGAKELKSLHVIQGKPMCFSISHEGYTELRIWNGNEFQIVQVLGKNAFPAYRRHSLVEGGDMIYWLGQDGIIYAYGKFEPGLDNALYKIGDMTAHVTGGQTYANSGILIAANGVETATAGRNTVPLGFYVSFSDTGGNHLKKWYPHAYDPATTNQVAHTGTIYTLVNLLPKLAVTEGMTIFFPAVGSGGSTELLDVKVYLNHSSTAEFTVTLTQDDAQRGWKWIPFVKHNVNAIQIGLAWKAQNLANNITPYMAVLEYQPVVKKF